MPATLLRQSGNFQLSHDDKIYFVPGQPVVGLAIVGMPGPCWESVLGDVNSNFVVLQSSAVFMLGLLVEGNFKLPMEEGVFAPWYH